MQPWLKPLESRRRTAASVILVKTSMPSRNPKSSNSALLEAPSLERERVFDLFRHWGYLEADLDPLGLFRPQPQPDLQIDGELAREARNAYCGTIGVEFMHITDPDRRRWIQERMEGEPGRRRPAAHSGPAHPRRRVRDRCSSSVTSAQSVSRSKATPRCFPWSTKSSTEPRQRGAVESGHGHEPPRPPERDRRTSPAALAEEVFAGFEDVDPRSVLGGGDVKYHMGATGEYIDARRRQGQHSPGLESQPPGSRRPRHHRTHPRQAGPLWRRRHAKNSCRSWSTATPHSPVRALPPRR